MRAWPDAALPFGGDYNPEQWPRQTWPEDVAAMRRAGVTFVSLGIFSWSWLEPSDGAFDFGWLDEVMGRLDEAGIAVDLATGTASPPMWLAAAHPEIAPLDRDGRRLWPGSRQAWCPSSATFTAYATRLAAQMAVRYHEHPALAMWHVSNEYGCHNTPCYCDTCAHGFREWLAARYPQLDALNDAWGTAFWSQRYTALEQVLPPRHTPSFANPGQCLDYQRYQSDALLGQFLAERAVLHEHSPGVPVTTNFMTLSQFSHLDYHRWVAALDAPTGGIERGDVVSTDHYVVDSLEDPWAEQAFCGDLTRGIAGGPWWLMEHSTSAVNWQPVNRPKPPGQLLRDSLTHVAHGADAIGFFQWRASRAGAEKYHSALLPHAGEDSRLFAEVCRLGAVAGRLGEVRGSQVEADVAILWDYDAQWATQGPAMPSSLVDYPDLAIALHRALREAHVAADVVHPSADLTAYRLVVVPTLYLACDAHIARIEEAVAAGAHVLVTYFSGIVDEHDHVRLGGYPGAFRDLLGVRTSEFAPLRAGEVVTLSGGGTGTVWHEDVALAGASAVTTVLDGPMPGRAALTRYAVDGTTRWYLTTFPDRAALARIIGEVVAEAGVEPVLRDAPAGVDLTRRRSGSGSWVFAINTGAETAAVPVRGHDLVEDLPVPGPLVLRPGAVAVVREA
jgi:beta-galactosidase